jgi:NTP pyrophosphatase (non-canonical NTP hydrolase)
MVEMETQKKEVEKMEALAKIKNLCFTSYHQANSQKRKQMNFNECQNIMRETEIKNQPTDVKNLTNSYIAGIIDSDGNIDCSTRKRKYGLGIFPKITLAQKNDYYSNLLQSSLGTYKWKQKKCNLMELNSKKAFKMSKIMEDFLVLKHTRVKFINQFTIKDIVKNKSEIRDEFLNIVKTEKPVVSNINIQWLAGFIDGDGCFMCYIPKNVRKPKFTLAITYDDKYQLAFEEIVKIYGGNIRKTTDTCSQWYFNLNTNSLSFINALYENMYFKKYQAKTIYEWLKKYPTHKKGCCSQKDVEFIHRIMREAKETILPMDMYQFLATTTAIYPKKHSVIYPTLGLCGEAGEVAEKIKKTIRDGDGEITEEKKKEIAKEISDIFWYLSALASDLELSVEGLAIKNLEKLFDRKNRGVLGGSGDNR